MWEPYSGQKCLVCKKLELPTRLIGIDFYGRWCYCHCPNHKSISLANLAQTRRLPMNNYNIQARVTLQELNEKDGHPLIEGFLEFILPADDFGSAIDKAVELIPDTYSIFACTELVKPL